MMISIRACPLILHCNIYFLLSELLLEENNKQLLGFNGSVFD